MIAPLTGTPPLLRSTMEHEGRRLAPWIALPTALTSTSVLVYPWVFPTEQDRAGLAAAIGANPAVGLIFGPAHDLSTVDGFNTWRSLVLGGFLVALGAIFTVVRTTRGQEDSGQAELLASGVLGRGSRLMTAVAMSYLGSLMTGLVAALVTVLCGGSPGPSLLIAATFTVTGWMFASVAAVTAQLGSDTRTSTSLAVGTLGVLFALRGLAYSLRAPDWAIWANPLGWMTETRPATTARWWPLLLAVALALLLLALAFWLQARRDFGQGAISPRPGPERGRIRSPLALAVRLGRGSLVTWTVAFVALGFVFGYFTTSVRDILAAESAVQQVLAAGAVRPDELVSAFILTILSLVGILAAVPGILTVLRMRSEELEDRVEPLITAAVARLRYFGTNVAIAMAASGLFVVLTGVLIAWIAASRADLGVDFADALLQAVATVPAVWTVVAVSVAVVGARPVLSLAAWVGVLASFGLTLLGPTFGLDDWVLAISPFWHVPNVAMSEPWTGLAWVSGFTLLFCVIGFAGFRRRDLAR